MTAVTANPPAIPPRPSRSQEKAASTATPAVPPRPNRRFQRSVSPNPDRFAPSPLINETAFVKSSKSLQPGGRDGPSGDPIARSTSVELPSLGEEGKEYAGLAEELNSPNGGSVSPEQTRTVAEDLKLHAPKPSLPASSAKERVMAVTRTDSERAASFGIGRPSSVEDATTALPSNRSLKKKASTASQLSATETPFEDEHGIPEIGQQVPMLKHAGDVQAPSPAPGTVGSPKAKHHARKTSARGNLPPGSYGLHGHGVAPQDKLEKAYFEKHPDLLKKEYVPHHHDRPNDFSMSRDDLNKIVRETASRGTGQGVKNYTGTPSDQVGWQALEESTSRIASPSIASPELSPAIHVEEPSRRRSAILGDTESPKVDEEAERPYTAPILADDEVAKNPPAQDHQPAVEPPAFELEEPSSRPTSRPGSLYKETSFEVRSTPLEDVEEYEPLFKDDEKPEAPQPAKEEKRKSSKPHRFPSADVWEDAPSSVFYTAEVSTPELFDEREKPSPAAIPPPREGETPAQAFARHQEELAEKEAHGHRGTQKPLWAHHQKHIMAEQPAAPRPGMQQRFPSRDVWEDTPESAQLQTTVSTPQQDEEAPSPTVAQPTVATNKPSIPPRPQPKSPSPEEKTKSPEEKEKDKEKPAIPDRRPKPRQASVDDKPAVPERPKPQIPARPAKAGPTSGGLEPAEAAAPPRQKPAVPARPAMGSKIAALQAGFMSDLNRRLQLGPQAVAKKEEASSPGAAAGEDEAAKEKEKEKVPLSDARKGRARGPQRRAPASVKAVVAAAAAEEKPASEGKSAAAAGVWGFVKAARFFEIDPDDDEGRLSAGAGAGGVGEPEPEAGAAGVVKEEEGVSEVGVVSAVKGAVSKVTEAVSQVKEKVVPEVKEKGAETAKEEEDVEESKAEANSPAGSTSAPAPEEAEKREQDDDAARAEKVEVSEPEPGSETKADTEPEPEERETKSLATNMAGETLIAEEVKVQPDPEAKSEAAAPEPEAAPLSETESPSKFETASKPEAASSSETQHQSQPDRKPDPEKQETKSLATNLAGETLIKEEIEKDEDEQGVESVRAVEN